MLSVLRTADRDADRARRLQQHPLVPAPRPGGGVRRGRRLVSDGLRRLQTPAGRQPLRHLRRPARHLPQLHDGRMRVRGRRGVRQVLRDAGTGLGVRGSRLRTARAAAEVLAATAASERSLAAVVCGCAPSLRRTVRSRWRLRNDSAHCRACSAFRFSASPLSKLTVSLIKPQTLKGFRDYLPGAMLARSARSRPRGRSIAATASARSTRPPWNTARSCSAKGATSPTSSCSGFKDQGDRDVAMRFDLTVPFARFAAEHLNEIGIAVQAVSHRHGLAGGEAAARPLPRVHAVRLRHDRHRLERLRHRNAVRHSRPDRADRVREVHGPRQQPPAAQRPAGEDRAGGKSAGVLRALDKLGKVGRDAVAAEMQEAAGATPEQAARVLDFAALQGNPRRCSISVEALLAGNERGMAGVDAAAKPVRRGRACRACRRSGSRSMSRSPADSITTPARSTKRSSATCRRSAASAPAAGTTTSPACSRTSRCRESAPAWGSTGCWPRWRN